MYLQYTEVCNQLRIIRPPKPSMPDLGSDVRSNQIVMNQPDRQYTSLSRPEGSNPTSYDLYISSVSSQVDLAKSLHFGI